MFEKDAMDILMKFLDRKVLEAEKEVTEKGTLSEDKAIPLMLKMQFNHIKHLEESVDDRFGQINQRFEKVDQQFEKVDQRFEQVNERFEQVNEKFEQIANDMNGRFAQITSEMNGRFSQVDRKFDHLQRNISAGFGILTALMTLFHFIR